MTTSAYSGARNTATIKCPREKCSNTLNFIARWLRMAIHRRTVACRRHLPPNQSLLSPVGQSDRDTLLLIIRTHISPGTRVMSDMWKAYDCLKDEGYTHLTVNHSLNFVDPDSGAHTQRNENTWWGVKRSMPRTGTSKDLFESYLKEWLWRQILLPKHYQVYPPTYMRN